MHRRVLIFLSVCGALLGGLALLLAQQPVPPAAAQEICFPEQPGTDCLQEPFASFWQGNGGLAVFGYPLGPAQDEPSAELNTTLLTQWTERNRLESHPTNAPPYDVLLGRMGAERLAQLGRDPFAEGREPGPRAGCLWFAETGHNVCDQAAGLGFRSYWEANGLADARLDSYGQSLALFGLPLTAAQMEMSPTDGQMYLTQWFERARFEWHPDNPDQFKVLLGLLGTELRRDEPAPQPVPPAPGPSFSPFGGEILERRVGRVVDEATAAGLTWVRYNGVLWPDVEPTPGARTWEALQRVDRELELLAANGLEAVLIVRHAPEWARQVPTSACSPITPEALDDFAAFMTDLVTRYSAPPYNVRYWELGNEPDVDPALISDEMPFGCWGDRSDPYYGGRYYAEMLKVVYPAIKAADPNAQVVVGGLLLDCDPTNAPPGKDCTPGRFFEGILENGGGAAFDLVGYHAYTNWNTVLTDWDLEQPLWAHRGGSLLGKADYLRTLMAQYGINKPLLANEIGLLCAREPADCLAGSFRDDQANYLVRTYTRGLANELAGVAWFTLDAPGWRLGGLVPRPNQGQPEPAYRALRFLGTTLAGAGPATTLADGSTGLEGYAFPVGEREYRIYWMNTRSTATVEIPAGATVYNKLGEPVTPDSTTLTIGTDPLIVAGGS